MSLSLSLSVSLCLSLCLSLSVSAPLSAPLLLFPYAGARRGRAAVPTGPGAPLGAPFVWDTSVALSPRVNALLIRNWPAGLLQGPPRRRGPRRRRWRPLRVGWAPRRTPISLTGAPPGCQLLWGVRKGTEGPPLAAAEGSKPTEGGLVDPAYKQKETEGGPPA